MGLKLTLAKTDNYIGCDFVDAYWSIDNIEYGNYAGVAYVSFALNTYASRDAKYLDGTKVPDDGIKFGGSTKEYYDTKLHTWLVQITAASVFPEGIPLSEAEQKQVLYTYVKNYTKLPFEDVLE